MKLTPRRRAGLVASMLAIGAASVLAGGIGASAATPTSTAHTTDSAAPACVLPEKPKSPGYDAATRHDKAFNRNFRHCFTTVDGIQMHYVIGGTGPQTLVMLHGWPQSWYEFKDIMPQLLPGRTLVAVDLPGLGDSTGTPRNFAASTLAADVHDLLNRIGERHDVRVIGHDFGAGVAYPLAAKYRDQISGLFMMDFPLVGRDLKYADISGLSFHFEFNRQDPLAEQLVTGRERQFLSYFYPTFSHSPNVIPARTAVDEYARVYSRPQVLHGGFELYRNWVQNESDNTQLEQKPLTIPVRLITEQGFLEFLLGPARVAAPGVTGAEVTGSGHWLPEEAPQRIISEINAFAPIH
jgi:pimeloyl-ACP methyl ester carboxylesterase